MGLPAEALDWSFACPDWIDRLKRGDSLVPDLPIDEVEGDRAVAIFNRLRLPDVPDQPTLGEAAGEWIRDIVRVAFGAYDRDLKRRLLSEIFALVPKKNAKTTFGAAIALTAMLLNERPRGEALLIGPTQEIADLAFQQCAGMIEADEYLAKRFLVQEHTKTIFDRLNKSRLKIKTFDMRVMTGSKPFFVLLDELHIMATNSYASRVLGQIRGGLMVNPESLLIMITTQSDTPPAGVFKAELMYARGVRDGRIEGGRLLPVLYEFPEGMQTDPAKPWADPRFWPMVLPSLGRSVHIDRLLADFNAAKEKGEEEIRRWASQHLNVEIGLALHSDRWRGADYWERRAVPELTLDELMRRSEVVVAGVDGGGLDDLYALSALGRDAETKEWLFWAKAWCHAEVLELRKDIAERLRDFAEDGDLVLCTQPTQDIREIADVLQRLWESGLMPDKQSIGLDPHGVAALIDELVGRDIPEDALVAVPQGYKLTGAVWGMERKLADGTLSHCGSELLAWCVGNARVEQRGNAVLITKQAAGKAKIDPLIAGLNAVVLMSRNPEATRMSLDGFLAEPVMVA